MHHIEDIKSASAQRGINAPSQHAFGTPLLDLPEGLTNGISASRTGSRDRQTGTMQTVVSGNYRSRHATQHPCDRVDPFRRNARGMSTTISKLQPYLFPLL